MTYRDFTIGDVAGRLGLTLRSRPLFDGLAAVVPPAWLPEAIGTISHDLLETGKSRSEFLIAPVLRAAQQVSGNVALHSGYVLNIDPAKGLAGECDFILALSERLPMLIAPAVSVVEAKKGPADAGLGQCIAQMRGLQLFNAAAGQDRPIWGALSSGDQWQFLRLDGDVVTLDDFSLHFRELDVIFARVIEMLKPVPAAIMSIPTPKGSS